MTEKTTLRRHFAAVRKAIAPETRQAADRAIRARIAALPEFRECRALALYATDGVEPDLLPLAQGTAKTLLFPRYRAAEKTYEFAVVSGPEDMTPGKYGLLEPAAACPAADAELVRSGTLHLVPGLAFDANGRRIGYGGGWYDRFLSAASPKAVSLGVCHMFQLVDRLPAEPHDAVLTAVVAD